MWPCNTFHWDQRPSVSDSPISRGWNIIQGPKKTVEDPRDSTCFHTSVQSSWARPGRPLDLSRRRLFFWRVLTFRPPRSRRWRRSRSSSLWDPWRTRLRRCWACPRRWGDQLLSPIPGNKRGKKKEKKHWWGWGPTAWEGFGKPSAEFTYFLKVEWRRASGWGKCLGCCHSRRQMGRKRSIKWAWF